ncbi:MULTISPECIES: HEAT repeat domain-containing protein [Nostocales]|uniref:WGR domain-containing protein n=3 Tax=Nostocales TaxID=1161 RepID=A0A0C1N881_9CYAN|nr:HEAT repeat domain-containing protein [Tolypothrix bouteillei]KAF3885564.1 WGR domain-containing protein [Tolypothrix bouteillei VB521301]
MKLIKRTTLQYQEGTSDKVYEVDLCQINEGRYVVNFRYGRRGTNLKEGTKTTQPVSIAEAEKAFNKLVEEKTKKGYRDISIPVTSTTPQIQPVHTAPPTSEDPRTQAILNRLANNQPSKWKLERAIWRAGELRIREATPLLLQLIGTGAPLRDYCIAWALGWCGDGEAIPALMHLYQNPSTPEFIKRIAFEAIAKLSTPQAKAAWQMELIEFLPVELRVLARNGAAEEFKTALNHYLNHHDYRRYEVLDKIYQIDNQYVRPALLDIISHAPLKPNYFQRLRHIFKVAEYRHDAEVFGILAYRFDCVRANFSSQKDSVRLPDKTHLRKRFYGNYNSVTRRFEVIKNEIEEELKNPQSRIAYSSNTRQYLCRRVWRTLKKLGEESDAEYIRMAVSILLQYSDVECVRETIFSWRSNWFKYAEYLTFNHILYENSSRYRLIPNSRTWTWRYQKGDYNDDAEPTTRDEAFPELWEQNPQALLQLLLESQCLPVHHFATKSLRHCYHFCLSIEVDTLIKLIQKPYVVTVQLGFELAFLNYNSKQPNKELVIAVANCLLPSARTQAYRWVEENREYFLEDSNFIAALIASKQTETRLFARRLLGYSILNDNRTRVLIGCIIAELLALTPDKGGELAKEIGETLLLSFTPQLRTLGLGVVNDLLAHPLVEIQEIGVRILLNHETRAENLPPQIIESLLASPHESLRVLGIRLFGQLPDEKLMGEESVLIVAIAVNPVEEIRNAIKPIIRRLGTSSPNFAVQLASDFIEILLTPEQHEGVHNFLARLLREDLSGWMTSVRKDTALQLLRAQSSATQELGGLVLEANSQSWISEITTSEIVKLANHEIVSVRKAAQQMFSQILERVRSHSEEMLAAVRMLEAKWEDSREFAFKIFTTQFGAREFTPQVLVSICDSVREEARRLGRDLLTRNFQISDSEEYLLKFSEHPSGDMQMFVTNYLEEYAGNQPKHLRELTSYFITVLSTVNRGRVAKQRIFHFLESEAQKNEETARIVAEIMTRHSATMAIGDKAKSIQILLKIHKKYPHLSVPIQIKDVSEIRL